MNLGRAPHHEMRQLLQNKRAAWDAMLASDATEISLDKNELRRLQNPTCDAFVPLYQAFILGILNITMDCTCTTEGGTETEPDLLNLTCESCPFCNVANEDKEKRECGVITQKMKEDRPNLESEEEFCFEITNPEDAKEKQCEVTKSTCVDNGGILGLDCEPVSCEVEIDGEQCTSCEIITCPLGGDKAISYNCTNVGGAVDNDCDTPLPATGTTTDDDDDDDDGDILLACTSAAGTIINTMGLWLAGSVVGLMALAL
eukprot:CAMPEP_0168741492 /NCGR_PEP_ID=MMETSP0724-20121128/12544_1 /TAXON_ID=265536 /ORGANISM="Amphiprora sp., Strain CCMP467" /LENGTH=257 /DNA_ID=CAMNT_0008789003 /DNA_START=100 /DNA_END=873 /DNA_ORIENTATION=-